MAGAPPRKRAWRRRSQLQFFLSRDRTVDLGRRLSPVVKSAHSHRHRRNLAPSTAHQPWTTCPDFAVEEYIMSRGRHCCFEFCPILLERLWDVLGLVPLGALVHRVLMRSSPDMRRWVLSTAEPVPGVHLVSSLHLWAGKSLNRHSFLHSPRGTTSMGTGRGDSKKSLQLQCQPPRPPPPAPSAEAPGGDLGAPPPAHPP